MSEPTVIEIVKEYLKAHGYDGLYTTECGCNVKDLAPCSEISGDCQAGYQRPDKTGEWDYIIGPKETEK